MSLLCRPLSGLRLGSGVGWQEVRGDSTVNAGWSDDLADCSKGRWLSVHSDDLAMVSNCGDDLAMVSNCGDNADKVVADSVFIGFSGRLSVAREAMGDCRGRVPEARGRPQLGVGEPMAGGRGEQVKGKLSTLLREDNGKRAKSLGDNALCAVSAGTRLRVRGLNGPTLAGSPRPKDTVESGLSTSLGRGLRRWPDCRL